MGLNNQLLYIMDTILMDIKFISKGVSEMFSIKPDKVAP